MNQNLKKKIRGWGGEGKGTRLSEFFFKFYSELIQIHINSQYISIHIYSTAIVKFRFVLLVSVTLFAVSVTSCLVTETTDTVSETHR